ncbi:MAG: hypothetical protein SynsKO_04100 [Synoicihabitans sp.]
MAGACLLASVSAWAQPEERWRLRVGGSELLGAKVTQILQDRVSESGGELRTRFVGSRLATDALEAGILEMAVLIEEPAMIQRAEENDWAVVPLGHVVAFVVAPHDLDLAQLSYPDLNRIFGAKSAVASTRWGEFGASSSWERVPIAMHVTTPAQGLSYEIFRHRVLSSPEFKSTVREHHTLDETMAALRAEDGGIGVVPWISEDETEFKALLVTPSAQEVAFGPTPENVAAGDYPLAIRLNLVFERARAPELLSWLKYWYGDEITDALIVGGIMPLPRTARNQHIFELEVIHEQE